MNKSSSYIQNIIPMDICKFKEKFGHYYEKCALDEMTGLYSFGPEHDPTYYPTYKTRTDTLDKYYRFLITQFCYNLGGYDEENVVKNEGWHKWGNDTEWHYGVQPQHIEFLRCLKDGNIAGCRRINNEGYYIGYYKNSMTAVAIDNERIESVDYLIKTKQIRDVEWRCRTTKPEFFDKLVDKYHIKFKHNHDRSPQDTCAKQLYLYYSNLHWIDPEEIYLNLKYPYVLSSFGLGERCYENPELLKHITSKYKIDEHRMCKIIKELRNSQRYISYCFKNNKLSDLKMYFKTDYKFKEWTQSDAFNITLACVYYDCIDLLDSLQIENIKEVECYKNTLSFYRKEINNACLFNMIRKRLFPKWKNFDRDRVATITKITKDTVNMLKTSNLIEKNDNECHKFNAMEQLYLKIFKQKNGFENIFENDPPRDPGYEYEKHLHSLSLKQSLENIRTMKNT